MLSLHGIRQSDDINKLTQFIAISLQFNLDYGHLTQSFERQVLVMKLTSETFYKREIMCASLSFV